MTDHVFTIALHVDEDQIVDGAIKTANKQLSDAAMSTFLKTAWHGLELSEKGERILKESIERVAEENKDAIIKGTIEALTEKIYRTKAMKDGVKDVMQ